jgi:oxygen-independent coproporphyrinogen-3 oxidase
MEKKRVDSLYVHIPFCASICPYCSFFKVYSSEEEASRYVDNILLDLEVLKGKYDGFSTIYVGGGTPTFLSLKNLERLLSKLRELLKDGGEFSIEANPETLSEEKIVLLSSAGINRLSLGVQSFSQRKLAILKRDYGIDISSLYARVKKSFSNINLDIIYGVEGERAEETSKDVDELIALHPTHISVYSLEVNPGSLFYTNGKKEMDGDSLRILYDTILSKLRKAGYIRYEVSNFSLVGYECRHNLTYRKGDRYVGIGPSSAGYEDDIRYKNSSNLTAYLNGVRKREEEKLSEKDLEEYFFLTNLRLARGFSLDEYKERFGCDFSVKHRSTFERLANQGLMKCASKRVFCTDEGLMLLDSILVDFFADEAF